MNSDYEQKLATRIDRALKALPELEAPGTLRPRVMAAIAARQQVAWYQRSWEYWPPALKVFSMAVMIAGFGGLCVAAWQLTQAAGYTAAIEEIGARLAWVGTIWKTLAVLVSAFGLVIKQLGTPFIAACLLALAIGYATCVGLGTVCVRLALARTNRLI